MYSGFGCPSQGKSTTADRSDETQELALALVSGQWTGTIVYATLSHMAVNYIA